MARIRLILAQLAVKLPQWYVGISPMVVSDPFQFLLGVGVWMWRMGPMGLGEKGFPRAIVLFIPPHQWGFWNLVLPTNIRNILCLTVKLYRIYFCYNFMWTIAFVCGIMFHEVIESFLLEWVRGNSILTELNHFFYTLFPWSHIYCNTTHNACVFFRFLVDNVSDLW